MVVTNDEDESLHSPPSSSSLLYYYSIVMEAHRVQLMVAALIFFILSSALAQQEVPLSSNSELSALLNLRSSLGIKAKYWPRKADPCSNWTGVECRNGRVVGISVSGLKRTRFGRQNRRFAVDSLRELTLLATFNSSGFPLPGPIPDWFGRRLSALQVLDLRSCSITGPIPSSLGNLSALSSMYLSDNSLTGVIPSTLGELSGLSVLSLSRNSLTGSIPSSFSALQNLSTLDLSSNCLDGPIPPVLGSVSSLRLLNLRNNSLAASIPAELGNLSQLIELDLGDNAFSGSLREDLGGLRSLVKMLVGNNGLEGQLPSSLFSNLTRLQYVDLSSNKLFGGLPEVQSMPQLRLIDLSGNYFQGRAANNSGTLNVTGNCLQNLPKQRSLQDCRLFYTDRGLIFDDGTLPNPTPAPSPEPASESKKRVTYIMIGLFGGLGFIVLLVLVLLLLLKTFNKGGNTNQRTENKGPVRGGSSPPSKAFTNLSGVGDSFTYKQMLQATGDFSDTNLIKHGHSGDLFRGTLDGGFDVVVKRVDLRSFRKESYTMELDFFSKTSHPRLVPLLGYCLENENEKLLVYKYMPHRDLSNSLYKFTNLEDDSLQSLDWITRSKIAIGAAEGLSYLHHDCYPSIVHRDIQASSILLDDKYEVRLGSLSEVHVQGGDNDQNVITRFLQIPRTFEEGPSGSSSPTCAYDVYCFGKVLLELITGKLGISKSDDAKTKEWLDQNLPYIGINEKEMVGKIVDQSLILDEDLLEEVWAMAIVAKSCLNPKPSRRPLMRHILKALENPLKVVREENFYSSARLRTTSSNKYWSAAFFGSWRQSSSESGNAGVQTNREGMSGLKNSGRVSSQGSGAKSNDLSSSNKRSSNEIFPEPVDGQDIERQDQN